MFEGKNSEQTVEALKAIPIKDIRLLGKEEMEHILEVFDLKQKVAEVAMNQARRLNLAESFEGEERGADTRHLENASVRKAHASMSELHALLAARFPADEEIARELGGHLIGCIDADLVPTVSRSFIERAERDASSWKRS